MKLEETFGDLEKIYKFGPSSLGNGIIDTSSLRSWFENNYMQESFQSFNKGTDEYLVQNKNRFISGKIYTFHYTGKGYDYHPIFLSITNKIEKADKLFEIGINLNMLKPRERVSILNGMIKAFGNKIQENIELIQKNENRQLDLPIVHKEYRDKFFDAVQVKPRFVKLNREEILRDTIKTISYSDWKYLIYYLPNTFINMSPQEVYKD